MNALFAELLTIAVVVTAVCWIVALERRAVVDEAEADEAGAWLDDFPAPDPAVELALWRASRTWRGVR